MNFQTKLVQAIDKTNSLVCVGLDTDVTKIPKHLYTSDTAMFDFNKGIIDATAQVVCSYKINSAFYEASGADGIRQLKMTCDYLRVTYSSTPFIADAKRADIGNTNAGYVAYLFNYLKADAVTLHPYLGKEALEPFLSHEDKGNFILCRTSNPGAGEIQDVLVEGEPLYAYIAKKVASEWNNKGNCMLVVGASAKELGKVRALVGDMFLLVPGIGAQAGDLQGTLEQGLTKEKSGLIIHSARSIIYADGSEHFAEKAKEEAIKLRDAINEYR